MNIIRRTFAVILLAGGAAGAFAQQLPPIPTDPNVRIGKLENGLTYYIRHNELPEKRADFYIAQNVGSILEEDNQRGLAHFLEHMCFNGTTHFPGNLLREYLEKIGVKFGENLNAYTSLDKTVYNISNVPVIRDGIVDSCLLVLHDWANDLTLDPKEIDKERGVIHEEWRTGMGAMMRMYEQTLPTLFKGSKYANRLPIGTMEVVDNFPYQALRDYYEKWYRPDLQGVLVVGDVDVDKIEAKIKEMFSSIEMPANPAVRVQYPVPDNDEPLIAIAKDKEQQIPIVYLCYKHDAVPAEMKNNMGYLAMNYMKSAAESMLNARLAELMQQAEPPFIEASVFDGDFILARTKGAFTGGIACKEDAILPGMKAVMTEVERMRRYGFTASEYSRAKADYLRGLESAYNERDKVKNHTYMQEYVNHFTDNEPIPGIENEYAIMNQIVPSITVEHINAMMKQLIGEKNMAIGVFCPEKEGMKYPTEAEIAALIKSVQQDSLEAYVDKVSDEPLLKTLPEGGKVTAQEQGAFGSTVLTLSNGVRVILKPTEFKADQIQMKAFSPGGNSLFDEKDALQFKVMNDLIDLGGLGNFSATDLDKVLAGKMASASAEVNTYSEGLSGGCSPKDLETMLQLVYLHFTAPRMDADAFASYKNRMKAALENQEANPMVAFSDSIQKAMTGIKPRTQRIHAADVDKIDYERVMALYNDRFKDASDFTFILVGNIDAATATPLLERYLGGLPAIHRNEKAGDPDLKMRRGDYRNVFQKAQETPKASVLVVYSGRMPYSLKNSMQMSMLNQLLNMEYLQTIREDAGGTYGVQVRGSVQKYPEEQGVIQMYFDTDPERRAHMTELINQGVEKFMSQGPDLTNLGKVKEFMLKKHRENVKENGYWMGALDSFYRENADFNTDYEQLLESISADDLKAFAKKFFGEKNRIEVSMTTGETR